MPDDSMRVAVVTGGVRGIGTEIGHRPEVDGLALPVLDLGESATDVPDSDRVEAAVTGAHRRRAFPMSRAVQRHMASGQVLRVTRGPRA
jgi:hypothetical protein